ncbi:tetratricopeptide repeat protein [Flavobacterium sp. ASW18X]|uniref:tetratricopeptide repeat protein n=1 Tax=Flavobacterium sp. ASW18X TaxID=2572595 RepID=UPI0010AECDA1|nr:tetratricopeptide repeat protein [Flavobacterium sp. ASW18X]TKD66231.1 hypothetical protein FBT53_04980 [Flavobacterium sp. ASW18X]
MILFKNADLIAQKQDTTEIKYDTSYVDLLNTISSKYRFRNPDSVLLYANKALDISTKIDYKQGTLIALSRLGDYYSDSGNYEKATTIYADLQQFIKEVDDPNVQINFLITIAIHYTISYDHADALKNFTQALSIAKENKLIKKEALIRHNMGYMFTVVDMPEDAHKEFTIADELYRSIGEPLKAAYSKSNMALNALNAGKPEKAIGYARASLKQFITEKDMLWMARSYGIHGRYHYETNNLDSALFYTTKAEKLLHVVENHRDWLKQANLLTKIYLDKKNLKKAEFYADSSLVLANKINDSLYLSLAHNNFFLLENYKQNKTKAIEHKLEAERIDKRLSKKQRILNLKLLQTDLALKAQQEKNDATNFAVVKDDNNFTLVSVCLLLSILLIALLIFREVYALLKTKNSLQTQSQNQNQIFFSAGKDLEKTIDDLKIVLSTYENKEIVAEEMEELTSYLKDNLSKSEVDLTDVLYWAKFKLKGIEPNKKEYLIKSILFDVLKPYKTKGLNLKCKNDCKEGLLLFLDQQHIELLVKTIIQLLIAKSQEKAQIFVHCYTNQTHCILSFEDNTNTGKNPQVKTLENYKVKLDLIKEICSVNAIDFTIHYPQKQLVSKITLNIPLSKKGII